MQRHRNGLLYRIPVLFWIACVAMLMNLSLSPLAVILPVLAKQARAMPAWFLGGLESSIGLGAIVGAVSMATVRARLRADHFVVLYLAMIGLGVVLLCPLLLLIPLLKEFMSASPQTAASFFQEHYPHAFESDGKNQLNN